MRTRFLIALAAFSVARGVSAQSLPSRSYLPLDHFSMPFLEHLIVRGALADPSPMERPWVVRDIADALTDADTSSLSTAERETLRQIREAITPRDGAVLFNLELQPGARASTHGRRDPVRPAGDGRALPLATGHVAFEFGDFVVLAQRSLSWHLRDDPDYGGDKEVPFQGRADYAYGAFRSRYAQLELGTVFRNWGPPSHFGLLVSPVPYSYDQVFGRFGVDRLSLAILVAELDEMPNRAGERSTRWWIVHRFNIRPADFLDIALVQSALVSGPARGLDLAYLNPFRFAVDTRTDTRLNANNQVEVDLELRLRHLPRLGVSFLIDDQINCFVSAFCPRQLGDEPPSYGFTGSLDGRLLGGTWSVMYTQIANLTYRTLDPAETLMIRGVGLARNFSDYDQTTVKGQWMVLPGLLLGPEFTLVRQGEGDFRQPFPTRDQYDATPTLFAGTVERTWRGAVHGALSLPFGLWIRWNAGLHRVTNSGHVPGATETDFVATVDAAWVLGWSWLFQ